MSRNGQAPGSLTESAKPTRFGIYNDSGRIALPVTDGPGSTLASTLAEFLFQSRQISLHPSFGVLKHGDHQSTCTDIRP